MSLVDPEKLIVLISDLEELLSSWNVVASDAFTLTEKLKWEGVEVHNLAEKDKSRSIETIEGDSREVEKSRKEIESLLEKSQDLLQRTSHLPDQINERVQRWRRACDVSNQHVQDANEWKNMANNEFRRAQNELDDATDEYNRQVNRYNSALATLNSTYPYYEVEKTDLKGRPYKEQGPNPEHERARLDVEAQAEELRRRERELNEKRVLYERAQEQLSLAKKSLELASDMQTKAQRTLEKSLDIKEWASNAERAASHAQSAIESSLRYNNDADKLNEEQKGIGENIIRGFDKLKTTLADAIKVIQDIKEQTSTCNSVAVQFGIALDRKKSLLYRLSSILPDKITPFKLY